MVHDVGTAWSSLRGPLLVAPMPAGWDAHRALWPVGGDPIGENTPLRLVERFPVGLVQQVGNVGGLVDLYPNQQNRECSMHGLSGLGS